MPSKRCPAGFKRYKGRCIQKAPEGQEHYMYYIRSRDVNKVDKDYVNMQAVNTALLVGYGGRHVKGVPIYYKDGTLVEKDSLP